MKKPFREALDRIEREHWWYRGRQVILERALDRFIGNPERSLAIGVGASREAEMLSKRTRLVAVDREEIHRRSAEVAMGVQTDAALLPFLDASFDAVFIFDVLEHIEGDDAVLEEIRRVLRPDGALLLTVPAFMFLFGRQDRMSDHKRRYRRGKLMQLVSEHGLEVQYCTYFNTMLFPPIAAARVARRWLRFPDGDGQTRTSTCGCPAWWSASWRVCSPSKGTRSIACRSSARLDARPIRRARKPNSQAFPLHPPAAFPIERDARNREATS